MDSVKIPQRTSFLPLAEPTGSAWGDLFPVGIYKDRPVISFQILQEFLKKLSRIAAWMGRPKEDQSSF